MGSRKFSKNVKSSLGALEYKHLTLSGISIRVSKFHSSKE